MTAVGGAAAASTVVPTTTTATASESPVTVRIYPGPVPLHGWVHAGFEGMRSDWPAPYRDAMAAVEASLDRVLEYANATSRLEGLEIRLERGAPVRFPLSDAPLSSEAVVPSLSTVLANFREQVRERSALAERTAHVLFCWSPLNFRVGYGGTLTPNAELGSSAGDGDHEDGTGDDTADEYVDGALTVANLGATEIWDSRAVTRNMAIHETLHTFLSPEVADEVGGSVCDHNLGAAVRTGEDDRTMEVTPMATAYAGPDELGGGTRFHGRGCHNHDEFHHHDGLENVDEWTYTTELSQATLEAVTRYLERTSF
ncbi:hypothetical protein G6M89_13895 [Natronolimnobius sp. AArcel1]|nr:hypothetical protein [Natronolimnobius sp. AArcel1]